MGKNVIRISERRAEPAVYMSALDRLMAGKDFDAAALVEEVEAIERAGQRPPPQFGEKLLAAMHALFIAAAERRGYEQGLIDGYKLAVTDIFRRYEERLEKLIRGFGGAAVVPRAEPVAEPLAERLDAAALVEEVEAIERAGQRPPPQSGEKLLAAMHALFIAAAERRGYEQGLIDGYKLAVTDIFRRKLIRGFGGAAVVPRAEPAAEPLAERRERPRGRPAEDDTPHVGEMVWIIIQDGNTFENSKAVSKAANQVAEGVPRRHQKKRKDLAKTLRYKFEKTLRGLKHLRCADSVADFARLSIQVSEERRRHGTDVLAQFSALQQTIDDSLRGLLETAQTLGDNRQKKN
jgi:hypothetical protein